MTITLEEIGCPKDCKWMYGDICVCEFSKNPCDKLGKWIIGEMQR